MNYPKEKTSLIIMDTFKGQDNKVIMDLCKENFCHVVIISHNLANKFQTLDITVNKPAKSFIADKYNAWFADEVTKKLVKGIKPADVKVLLALSELKPLHTEWIIDAYKYLCKQPKIIKNGFRATGIAEAVEFAHSVVQRIENPFMSNL